MRQSSMTDRVPSDVVPTQPLMLTGAECQLILHIRALKWGDIEVKVQDGVPVLLEVVRTKIRLV